MFNVLKASVPSYINRYRSRHYVPLKLLPISKTSNDAFYQLYRGYSSSLNLIKHSSIGQDAVDEWKSKMGNKNKYNSNNNNLHPKATKKINAATSTDIQKNIISSANNSSYTSISFYKFVSIEETLLDFLVQSIKSELSSLSIKGTLLLSKEGVNGQFALP